MAGAAVYIHDIRCGSVSDFDTLGVAAHHRLRHSMRTICIPHTELPGTSALFADYLYRFDRVARFYRHDPHNPASISRAAAEIDIPHQRRQDLIAVLRETNGESPALSMLELPDTVAIVTGQQVGLFGGPAYTLYKALTAAKLAHQLNNNGIRAVPVFWLATEDHDFQEINHCQVYGRGRRPVRLESGSAAAAGRPAGSVVIQESPLNLLRQTLSGLLHSDEITGLVEDAYQPGMTFGAAFKRLMERLLAGFGFIFIDPLDPGFRRLAAPLLSEAASRTAELSAALKLRGADLASAGYHAQVHFEDSTSLFFLLEDDARVSLKLKDGQYFAGSRAFSPADLAAEGERLSPTALLRPVMQDYLLPTAAYIGGPAEIAYLAQSEVLYRALLGRAPVPVSRSGFTLIDERSRMLMERYHLTLADCFHGEDALRRRVAQVLLPDELDATFQDSALDVRAAADKLRGQLHEFDPTLAAAMEKSKSKMLYQLEKIRKKAAAEALRRNSLADSAAGHISGLVFPNRHLQERYYSILPFLATHGLDLIDTIYENTQQGCPDHLMLTV
jgi:bacillithiol biosynthesis cysteine-adding enzyme BshC